MDSSVCKGGWDDWDGCDGWDEICSVGTGVLNPISEAFGGGATVVELLSPSSSLFIHFLATGSQTIY